MWRLTMSDGAALLSPELDADERAAAIAAMAARLAAARPRAARRPLEQAATPTMAASAEPHMAAEPPGPDAALPKLDVPRERLAQVSAPPPAPWRQHIGTVRQAALLSAMAGAGFAAVVLAQSPSVAALLRGRQVTAAAAAAPAPSTAPQAPGGTSTASIAPDHAMRKVQHLAAAGPRDGTPAAHRPAHDRLLARALAEPARAAPRRPSLREASLSGPRAAARQPDDAPYVLPRWLTEPQPAAAHPDAAPAAAPQPVIMSPPPHDLALPPAPAVPGGSATVNPPAPKPPQPEMIFAATGYPPPALDGGAPNRPAFAPPEGPPYGAFAGPYPPP